MKKIMSGWLVISVVILAGCAASIPPAVGVWSVTMDTPFGALPATLTINADGSGSLSADALGEAPITGITFDGNAMAFEAEIDAQGQTVVLVFTGTVDGDTVEGEFGSDFGAFGVSGSRN